MPDNNSTPPPASPEGASWDKTAAGAESPLSPDESPSKNSGDDASCPPEKDPGQVEEDDSGHEPSSPEKSGDAANADNNVDAQAGIDGANGGAANSPDKNEENDGTPTPPEDYGQGGEGEPGNVDKDGDKAAEEDTKTMGLLDHLNELRARLAKACLAVAIGFGICWVFVDPLFDTLIRPLLAVLPEGTHAQYTTLPEAFFTRMYIALVAGIFLASPAIFYQIWAFVAPGLYDEEKRYILPIAFLSAIFFIAGAVFCYFIVFPYAFRFFISFSTPDIVITPKVSDYLSFTIKLLFAFGLIFEMPIFTFFLARLGILTAGMMRKGRKFAIVGIFIVAAILTPPDVLSQVLMAVPMLLLYEISIGVAAIFGKKKTEDKTQEDKAEQKA